MNPSPTTKICRWGILGTAKIARRNWEAICNAENATLVAVASRKQSSAQAFIDHCQSNAPFETAPVAVEGYQAVLDRDDIDAVYIPLPTGVRQEWVIEAARAGKHVLCEKPCAVHQDELKEMLSVCRDHGVQFMDGVMFMHTQRMVKLKEVLNDETSVGKIRRITSHFSFFGSDEFKSGNIRTSSHLEPLGCLGDLGWYNIRLALWALDFQMPQRVMAHALTRHVRSDSQQSVPVELSAELFFKHDVTASFYNSFLTQQQQWAHLVGTEGEVFIADFVQPFHGDQLKFTVGKNTSLDGWDFSTRPETTEYATEEASDNAPTAQESEMFRCFSEIVNTGNLDSRWPEMAWKTQKVVDAVFESAKHGGRIIEL